MEPPRHRRLLPQEPARARRTAIHVVILERRWAVIRFGEREPLSMHDQKSAAICEARRIASREGAELLVFDLGGRLVPPDSDSLAS